MISLVYTVFISVHKKLIRVIKLNTTCKTKQLPSNHADKYVCLCFKRNENDVTSHPSYMFASILHGTHQTNEKKQLCHFLWCRGFCSSECVVSVARQPTIFDKACVVYAVQSRHLCVTALIDYGAKACRCRIHYCRVHSVIMVAVGMWVNKARTSVLLVKRDGDRSV